MRARNRLIAAIGAAAGVIIAVTTAVAPASASKLVTDTTTTTTASYSCASFEGLKVTAPSVSYTGIGLQSGESITVSVSSASSTDSIRLAGSAGFSIYFGEGPATQPYKFTAPSSTVYSLKWTYSLANDTTSTASRTWTFDCSSTSTAVSGTTADSDRDGVADSSDKCAGTILPDSYAKKVAGSYYANSAKNFVDGAGHPANITVADAGGCSATQIAKSLGLSQKQSRYGISLSILTSWASTH